jgi:hypothetical protein
MRMRAFLITGLMTTGLAVSQGRHVCVTAMERSTHAFYQYFQALRQEPLNPVQRIVFSLALTNAKAHEDCGVRPPRAVPALLRTHS